MPCRSGRKRGSTGDVEDFWWDSDGDGIVEPYPSQVVIELYNASQDYVCSAWFDASGAVEIDPATWTAMDVSGAASGPIWRAWTLPLTDGDSDCVRLDPTLYGTTNVLDLFAGWSFGFGLGQANDLAARGTSVWGATWYQYDFDAQYFTTDGLVALETAYDIYWDVDDCNVLDTTEDHDPAEGWLGVAEGFGYWLLPL